MNNKNYRDLLQEIYTKRKTRNPSYSLVAFSRDAGFKSYHMSDILSGRYGLSVKRAVTVAENLHFSKELTQEFLALVGSESTKNNLEKKISEERLSTLQFTGDKNISDQDFDPISEWYYFAILEMTRNSDNLKTSEIALRLNIDLEVAEKAISNLIDSKLISQKSGSLQINHEMLVVRSQPQTPSSVLRKYHKQLIEKSLISMENDPIEDRAFQSFNMCLSKNEYENLLIDVTAFIRKKITTFQTEKNDSKRLYAMSLQLFPLEVKNE